MASPSVSEWARYRSPSAVLSTYPAWDRTQYPPFVARRVLRGLAVLFVLSVVAFGLVRLLPGNPADVLAGPYSDAATRARLAEDLGLNQPVTEQYLLWLGRLLHGDFGLSAYNGMPVLELIKERLPNTLELALAATVVSVLWGVPRPVGGDRHESDHGAPQAAISADVPAEPALRSGPAAVGMAAVRRLLRIGPGPARGGDEPGTVRGAGGLLMRDHGRPAQSGDRRLVAGPARRARL
ncbi:ABC transporter permease [Streptomyces lonegramiae]|uniref:ABC transporter permease n=1 Tax=Streptomyces lonegramiae TaxID=3075524 RepID=UPI00374E1D77